MRKVYLSYILFLLINIELTSQAQIPDYLTIVNKHKSSYGILLDRKGNKLQTIRWDYSKRQIEWWELESISPYLIEAIIQAEDKNFFSHPGVDGNALIRAIFDLIFKKKRTGASTLSMQVVTLLGINSSQLGKKKSIFQKIKQMNTAVELEEKWNKKQILNYYINYVPMRGDIIGIPTASFAYFKKSPSFLTPTEALILVSMIPSPNAKEDKIYFRAKALSKKLNWEFSEASWQEWKKNNNHALLSAWQANDAFHYLKSFYYKKPGIQISTLDIHLQKKAISLLKSYIHDLKWNHLKDGAVVIIHNPSGDILAYATYSLEKDETGELDAALAFRQAGSSLKPFLYGLAIDKKLLTSSTILSDEPLDLSLGMGVYRPKNYDLNYRGYVTAQEALASSLNVPAVRTIDIVGIEPFYNLLIDLGFQNLREPNYYGYSLALGTADIRLLDLTRAYSILARNGRDYNGNHILSKESAYIISQILSNREARSSTFGLENNLSTRFFTAVKTGTSQDMRDNWCIGYNAFYTVGVWMGNLKGDPMHEVTGVTGAAPIWRELMEYLYSKQLEQGGNNEILQKGFPKPESVTFKDGFYYIKGTEPIGKENPLENDSMQIIKIFYPQDGMIFTVDPDIPPHRQRIVFQSSSKKHGYSWYLNGKVLTMNSLKDYPWQPKKGKYKLEILDSNKKILDAVQFEVR